MNVIYIEPAKVQKILLIKFKGIGDVILSTIVINNLKKDFPYATIDFLTEKPSYEALSDIENINEVIIFKKNSLSDKIKSFWGIRKRKYDLIFDFYSNPTSAQLTFFSNAPYRVGFPYKGRKYAYNLYGPGKRDNVHSAELHLQVLKKLKLSHSEKELQFGLTEENKSYAKNIFSENGLSNKLVVGISPSGGWASKKCSSRKFVEIAEAVQKKYSCKLFILWGPGDKTEAEEIKNLLGDKAIIAPPTSIRQMASLLNECSIVIANDSGPMHITTAVGTPTLSIHGPTNPLLQGPYGVKHEHIILDSLDCIICNLLDCPKNQECFENLPTENIVKKVDSLLSKNSIIIR